MKKLYCHKCGREVGQIAKGRILKTVIIYCGRCQDDKGDNFVDDFMEQIKGMSRK